MCNKSFSIISVLAVASVLFTSLPSQSSDYKGCDPRRNRDGCAGNGAPIVLSAVPAGNQNASDISYLIVAKNHSAVGLKGWCDRTIKVGDLTTMRPQSQRSDDFPIPVTYQNVWTP